MSGIGHRIQNWRDKIINCSWQVPVWLEQRVGMKQERILQKTPRIGGVSGKPRGRPGLQPKAKGITELLSEEFTKQCYGSIDLQTIWKRIWEKVRGTGGKKINSYNDSSMWWQDLGASLRNNRTDMRDNEPTVSINSKRRPSSNTTAPEGFVCLHGWFGFARKYVFIYLTKIHFTVINYSALCINIF